MRIVEFIHDDDHTVQKSNIDLWVEENRGFENVKFRVNSHDGFPNIESFDLLILHGGAQHLWDKDADPWLSKETEYVRKVLECDKPVIGFCLGSQIIAEAIGSKVYKADKKELGFYHIEPAAGFKEHILLDGLENGFISFEWHEDHFDLPNGCRSLGYTKDAKNQIFISENVRAAAFQFHPEYTKEIIRESFEMCMDETWNCVNEAIGRDEFSKAMDLMPKTYDLFKLLIENAIKLLTKK